MARAPIERTSCGEILCAMLAARGIEVVFGIPGVHTVALYRGLDGAPMRHVTPRHEQGAGFMADGYARASGKPAACFVITGPGLTNAATAMGQALADSVPMVVIASVAARADLGRGEGRLHELPDQAAIAAGLSRFARALHKPDDAARALDDALDLFAAGRPGPVALEVPLDVLDGAWPEGPPPRPRATPAPPDQVLIDQAAALLQNAREPMVILGGGAIGAAAAIAELIERIGAPTALTINAKGLLPPDHPLQLGSLLPTAPVLDAARSADVLLAIGTELGETDTLLFGERFRPKGSVIRIDVDPAQLARNAEAAIAIAADAGVAARALASALGPKAARDAAARARALRTAGLDTLPEPYRVHGRLFERIAARLPGAIFAGDSTQPIYGANYSYDAEAPRRFFNSATGFGTLGYAIPAAIGAKIARPDAPVVAVAGDGGAMFTIPELAAAAQERLALPIILWNNHGYREIKDHMIRDGVTPVGVDLLSPDFEALAKGFGCAYARPTSGAAFDQALERAASADRPMVIELDETIGLAIGRGEA